MAKGRRQSRVQAVPLTIGQDPALWRYGSLREALEANTSLLAHLIQAGQHEKQEPVIQALDDEENAGRMAAR